MGKISKFFDKYVYGDSPSQKMEDQAQLESRYKPYPTWFGSLRSSWSLVVFGISLIILVVFSLVMKNSDELNLNSAQLLAAFILPLTGIIIGPLALFARIQSKLKFRGGLTPEQKVIYDSSIKKRAREFIILFVVALFSAVFFSYIVYLFIRNG